MRAAAGLFDLSHMGELWVSGPDAAAGLAAALVTRPRPARRRPRPLLDDLRPGRRHHRRPHRLPHRRPSGSWSCPTRPTARSSRRRWASAWPGSTRPSSTTPRCDRRSWPSRARRAAPSWSRSRTWTSARSATTRRAGHAWRASPRLVARTGYTGRGRLRAVRGLATTARPCGTRCSRRARATACMPCGLGARDTLRLEAGMPLYGNELDRATTPFEAGLGRVVHHARQARRLRRSRGPARRGGRPPRTPARRPRAAGPRHRPPRLPGAAARAARSPSARSPAARQSPTLGVPIAMAYVPPADASAGTMVEVGDPRRRGPCRGRPAALLPTAALTASGPRPRRGDRPDR